MALDIKIDIKRVPNKKTMVAGIGILWFVRSIEVFVICRCEEQVKERFLWKNDYLLICKFLKKRVQLELIIS
uniref:Uncharacterized protein n=1 Tax=Helianthus annuus TaxID=4232 RepID=A0A251SXM5_HELAN